MGILRYCFHLQPASESSVPSTADTYLLQEAKSGVVKFEEMKPRQIQWVLDWIYTGGEDTMPSSWSPSG